MPTDPRTPQPVPGLDIVGRGIYLRPNRPYELKPILFDRGPDQLFQSRETGETYLLPAGYHIDDSPPMPAAQALNQSMIEESWERFEKHTGIDASAALSNAPFSVDVTASQAKQLRQEEDSYYALRTTFMPLWSLYIPTAAQCPPNCFELHPPVPFSHRHRAAYAAFFERYGTHYVKRAWVGGKATLAFAVTKTSDMTKSDIRAGLQASMAGLGGASVNASDQRSKEKLQSNSQCTVFGRGGDEFKLAALSTLDDAAYNEWLVTVRKNPQLIEFDVAGIWTLVPDPKEADALMFAYQEENSTSPLRAVFQIDNKVYFFEDTYFYVYDVDLRETSKPELIRDGWPELARVGFERADAAFLGKYLTSQSGEDLSRKLFLFNRDSYVRWDVDSRGIDPGYPRLITQGWPGVPFDRIDAAVNVAPDALYLFKGDQYVRFNTIANHVDPGYPESVNKRWVGLPFDRIDAASYWGNAKIYFFRGDQYVRYDTVMWRADAGYPRSILSHYVEDWRFFE